MVREHLPVVLAALLDVHDEELLKPEGGLDEVVPFHEGRDGAGGVIGPHFFEIEPVGGVGVDVLDSIISLRVKRGREGGDLPCPSTKKPSNTGTASLAPRTAFVLY